MDMRNLWLILCGIIAFNCAANMVVNIVPGKTDYEVVPSKSGVYWIVSHAKSKIPVGKQHMAQLRIGDGLLLTRRLLAYNRIEAREHLERVELQAGRTYKFYFKFDESTTSVSRVQLLPQRPYPVPKAARNYIPKLIPPKRHPRLFVNPEFLARLKETLNVGDNLPVWEKVRAQALAPMVFKTEPDKEVGYNKELLEAVQAKAFYYLVTKDKNIGNDAVKLITAYTAKASLGNGQDICRRVGEIIFTASLVYDWCYDLLPLPSKDRLRHRMLFYAAELEASWPPFRQYASAGHGNEAQFNRDLLSMALAIYDEDPKPYSYVAYQIFEIWQPLKEFTHKSGRHSQGSSYGQYRGQFDFLAALQIWRVFGKRVLPPEAKELPYYWYYLRMPDGCFLIEGDDNWKVSRPQYVPINPMLLNCLMALDPNPEFKAELIRGIHPRHKMHPIIFLLANDPRIKPQDLRAKLPLSRLYKDPLPGMAVRTGWNFTADSDDMVLTINGGNRHLRNHQHGDLGSFQLYYHGYLITDLGQYRFYGIPFDRQFNKTAALHSMMRFYDPAEKVPANWINTGSQFMTDDRPPLTLKSFLNDKRYYCGETPRAGFGPDKQKPVFNFLETILAPAYPGRVSEYSRSFVFWKQGKAARPGTLIILDRFRKSKDSVKPIFQLTTIKAAVWKNGILTIRASRKGKSGCVTVTPLIPGKAEVNIFTGDAMRNFNGKSLPARFPERREAKGSRIEITGAGDIFLNVLQVHESRELPRKVTYSRQGDRLQVNLMDADKDYITGFGKVETVTDKPFSFTVRRSGSQVLLLDLAPGKWEVVSGGNKKVYTVSAGKGAIYDVFTAGDHQVRKSGK